MKEKTLYRLLIFWELFIGIGAAAGAIMMFADPTVRMLGMEPMLPMFRFLPFAHCLFLNFLFPGISLFLYNGIINIVSLSSWFAATDLPAAQAWHAE